MADEARVTQAGVIALQTDPSPDARVTQAGIIVLRAFVSPVAPDTPTLTFNALSLLPDGGIWTGSNYNSSAFPPTPMQDSQVQVDDTSGAFGSIVFDDTFGVATSGIVSGLLSGTGYWARLRYQDANSNWSSWSATVQFTTTGLAAPNQAVLSVPLFGETWANLATTAYSHPSGNSTHPHGSTDWQIATDSGFTSVVHDAVQSLDLEAHRANGLLASTLYYARARWIDQFAQAGPWSATQTFTTLAAPGARPATPTLSSVPSANSVALTGSAFSGGSGTHLNSEWEVATANTFAPATLVYSIGWDATNLLTKSVSGLTANTTYYARLRYQDDALADSLFSTTDTFLTATSMAVPVWTAPVTGGAVRGVYTLGWSITGPEADATYQIDYSVDNGVSWISVAAAATGTSDTWDVSALADDTYILRIRQESVAASDESIWVYATVFVDNGLDVGLFSANESNNTPADWTQVLDDYKAVWDSTNFTPAGRWKVYTNGAVPQWPGKIYGIAGLTYDPALQPTQFDAVAEVEIVGRRAGYKWTRGYDVESCGAGIGGRLSGLSGSYAGSWPATNQAGIAVYFWMFPASTSNAPLGKGPGNITVRIMNGTAGAPIFSDTDPLGFDVYSSSAIDIDPLDRNPYNIRLLVTQIRDNGDGTEDLRIRIALYGANVDPSGTGWVYDKAVNNIPKLCGGVGYIGWNGSGQSYINTGSKDFRSLGVRGLDYDTCTAPSGFVPPVLGSGCAPPIFDLTFYDDTDTNALIGTATDLNITDASFSTDTTHARPYLIFAEYGRPRLEIDPLRGKSTLAEVTFAVLDKRGTVCDWSTGAITGEIGDAAGESNFNGRRFVLRERLGDGVTWEIIADGVVYQSRLDRNLVRFVYTGRSIRERERETQIFTTPNRRDPVTGVVEPTSYVYPIGPAKDYGKITITGLGGVPLPFALVKATPPSVGTFRAFLVGGVPNGYGYIETGDIAADVLTEDHLAIGIAEEQFDANGVSLGQRWPYVGIRWRPVGSGTWIDVKDMPVPAATETAWPHLVNYTNLFISDSEQPTGIFGRVYVQLSWPGAPFVLPPTDGQQIEFYVYARSAPSPTFPLYWDEGTYGDLLKEIMDGAFGDIDPLLRYDLAQVTAMQASTQLARIKINNTVTDMRDWLEKNVYQPTGWVASLNANKELCPLDTALPNAGTALSTLDETNTRHGDWNQDGGDAIHLVEFAYIREYTEQAIGQGFGSNAQTVQILGKENVVEKKRWYWWDKVVTHLVTLLLIERPVVIGQVSTYAATSGLKPFRIQPDSVRTLGGPGGQAVLQQSQSGANLAHARIRDILQRYPTGPEFVTVSARNTATVRSLKVGNFVIIDLDWVPNLSTNDRGGQLVALIVSMERRNNLLTSMTLLIAGGSGTGLTLPTVGAPTTSSANTVAVPVSAVPASTTTVVQVAAVATGAAVPAESSGLWQLVGVLTAPGTVTTAPYLPDVDVWVRARSEQTGFRPSAWTTPAMIAVSGPALLSLRVVPAQNGDATVFFTVNGSTAGLYVEYEVHQPNQNPGYSNVVHWDASAGIGAGFSSGFSSGFGGPSNGERQRALGIAMTLEQRISVRVTPYDGWTGTEVSGTAGARLTASAIMETAPAGSGFSSGFSLGFGS